MKKILTLLLLAAVAAVACLREQQPVQENGFTVSIQAGMPETTRTFIEPGSSGWIPSWHSGDVLGVMVDGAYDKPISFTNTAADGRTGTFTGTLTGIADGSHTFTAWYPKELKAGRKDAIHKYVLGDQMLPSLTTFDPSQDLLVGLPTAFTVSDGVVTVDEMRFRRIFAVVKLTLKDQSSLLGGALVKSVTLTAGSTLTGKANVDITTGEIDKWESASPSVKGIYENGYPIDGSNSMYLLVNPVSLAAGSALTVEVVTDNDNLLVSKTVSLPSAVEIAANKVTTLSFTLTDENVTDKSSVTSLVWDFSSAEWQDALAAQASAACLETNGNNNVASWSVTLNGLTYASGSKNGKWSQGGYIQPNGAGSTTERVFSFTAPADGVLKVTVSGTNADGQSGRSVTVNSGGSESSQEGGASINSPVVLSFSVKEGTVKVYPTAGLRFYKLAFSAGSADPGNDDPGNDDPGTDPTQPGDGTPHTYAIYVNSSKAVEQTVDGTVGGSFFATSGSVADFSSNYSGSVTIGDVTYIAGIKFNSSGYVSFTTSATFSSTVRFYAISKSASSSAKIQLVPKTGEAVIFDVPYAEPVDSGVLNLEKGMEYTIRQKSTEQALILAIVTESE